MGLALEAGTRVRRLASMMVMVRRPIVIAASIVALLATACSGGRGAPPRTKATTAAAVAHFNGGPVPAGLSFDYPTAWRAAWWDDHSSFSNLVTYLSPLPLHDPCARFPTMVTCGDPIASLPPGGVLVSWSTIGFPHFPGTPEVPNPNTTVSGQPARVVTDYPGDCGRLLATETITANIAIPEGNHYEMTACLRDPGIAADEALVRQMLATVRITS